MGREEERRGRSSDGPARARVVGLRHARPGLAEARDGADLLPERSAALGARVPLRKPTGAWRSCYENGKGGRVIPRPRRPADDDLLARGRNAVRTGPGRRRCAARNVAVLLSERPARGGRVQGGCAKGPAVDGAATESGASSACTRRTSASRSARCRGPSPPPRRRSLRTHRRSLRNPRRSLRTRRLSKGSGPASPTRRGTSRDPPHVRRRGGSRLSSEAVPSRYTNASSNPARSASARSQAWYTRSSRAQYDAARHIGRARRSRRDRTPRGWLRASRTRRGSPPPPRAPSVLPREHAIATAGTSSPRATRAPKARLAGAQTRDRRGDRLVHEALAGRSSPSPAGRSACGSVHQRTAWASRPFLLKCVVLLWR